MRSIVDYEIEKMFGVSIKLLITDAAMMLNFLVYRFVFFNKCLPDDTSRERNSHERPLWLSVKTDTKCMAVTKRIKNLYRAISVSILVSCRSLAITAYREW
jgi:hypothetical protein